MGKRLKVHHFEILGEEKILKMSRKKKFTSYKNQDRDSEWHWICQFSSVQFSRSFVSDSLRPHESQCVRPPCPSPTPGVYPNPSIESAMPSSHLNLCRPLLLLPLIPPSIRVFSSDSTLRMRWPKYWSFSFSISPSNEHPGLISFKRTGWISLQSKGLSRVFSNTTVQKHQLFGTQLSSQSNSHIHTWPLEKS